MDKYGKIRAKEKKRNTYWVEVNVAKILLFLVA